MELKGVKWFGGWDIRSFPQRGAKPYNISPQMVQRLSNGNTLICECWDVIEVTPEGRIVWQFGEWAREGSDDTHLKGALSAWEYESTGKVIIADTGNSRILEVDKKTKKITRKLLGLKHPVSCFVEPDSGNLIVAEKDTHLVYEIDWEGNIRWQFGTKDEEGSDQKHLRRPWFAYPAKSGWDTPFDSVLISDYGNNRVILVRKKDKKIIRETLSIGPESAYQTQNLGVAVTGQIVGFVTDQDWNLRWYTPNNWRVIPTPDLSFVLIDRVNLFEVIPDILNPPRILPGSYRLLTDYPLKSEKSAGPIESEADFKDIPPIPSFAFQNGFTLYITSTCEAKLSLLTARTKWSWAPTFQFDGWEVYEDGLLLHPNKLFKYQVKDDHLFMGFLLRVKRGGTINAWITWR